MCNDFINIELLENQELSVKSQTEVFYGKNRKGFCDLAMNGIGIFSLGLNTINSEEINDVNENSNIIKAHKSLAYLHYDRVFYSFKSCYNIFLNGYYTEAAILLRSIIETFVRLKYIESNGTSLNVFQILAGHYGYKGVKYKIKHEQHFNKVSDGLYEYYRLLCDMTHGTIGPQLLRTNSISQISKGLNFHIINSTFITNQYSVYLLAHLEYFIKVFPEIYNNLTDENRKTLNEVKSILWNLMTEISMKERNRNFYNAVKKMIEY